MLVQKHRQILAAILRVLVGWIFFWAFIDKVFGLGFSTCTGKGVMCSQAWLMGGSPTAGFLGHAAGPLGSSYQALAASPLSGLIDWLFMLGLLGIGVSLILGAGMKLSCYGGAILLIMMYGGVVQTSNPFLDEHLVYAVLLVLLRWMNAGHYYGLGEWWEKHAFVKKHPWLD